jgi:protein gp37
MSTEIEWTQEVWNFLRGCSRDNAECDRCYAMFVSRRGLLAIDAGLTKLRPKDSKRPGVDWTGKIAVMTERLGLPLRWKKPRKVFVNSMSDLFHPGVPFEVIAAAFGVMAATPRHTYQVLTKRPERAAEFFAWLGTVTMDEMHAGTTKHGVHTLRTDGDGYDLALRAWYALRGSFPWPLPNVHLGVSAGRQETAEEKVPALLRLPAAVRWVSAEPLLGEVDFTKLALADGLVLNALRGVTTHPPHGSITVGPRLDWIVPGGESGSRPRWCDLAWIRRIVKQGAIAGVPVFVKQLGGNPIFYPGNEETGYEGVPQLVEINDAKGGHIDEWPEDLRVRQWPA